MPGDWPCVAESGVQTPGDAARVARLGYRLALVGTSLMRRADAAHAVRELVEAGREARD
jgi:indole-3-glycerol phosphate synthase